MRNHVEEHLRKKVLTSVGLDLDELTKPYKCPIEGCGKDHYRDKINFARHIGYGHGKLYNFCTEEELEGLNKEEQVREDFRPAHNFVLIMTFFFSESHAAP